MRFISGEKKLPSKSEMLEDSLVQVQNIWNMGFPKRRSHFLLPIQREYFNQLSELGATENIPLVTDYIALDALNDLLTQPATFRQYKYTVIDDKTYTKEKL